MLRLPAASTASKVSLDRLLRFGPAPLPPSKLIESAELTRIEITERLQRRVNAHLGLPYLPASNPHIKQVMAIYNRSLESMHSLPPIRTGQDNLALVDTLEAMVDDAADVIGLFATGFQESRRYLSEEQIGAFLDRAIQGRLSIRLLAEQHLALCKPSPSSSAPEATRVGIVDRELDLRQTAESVLAFVRELSEGIYGLAPQWKLTGQVDTKVCFVGMHLQYILVEVLKNAFRATIEHHRKLSNPMPLPPVELTFSVHHPERTPSPTTTLSVPSEAVRCSPGLSIRIRDQGGGIQPCLLPHIFSYAFTTVGCAPPADDPGSHVNLDGLSDGPPDRLQSGLGRIAGLGFGLPMARLYCRYFGGNLEVVNVHGRGGGVDSYITVGLGI